MLYVFFAAGFSVGMSSNAQIAYPIICSAMTSGGNTTMIHDR